MHVLETVISVLPYQHVVHHDSITTHASTQHIKMNPLAGPTYGIFCNANDTATEVKTITTLYAEVAIAVTIPLYVTGCVAVWAPCCRVYVLLAMIWHQVLCRHEICKCQGNDRHCDTPRCVSQHNPRSGRKPHQQRAKAIGLGKTTQCYGGTIFVGPAQEVVEANRMCRWRLTIRS